MELRLSVPAPFDAIAFINRVVKQGTDVEIDRQIGGRFVHFHQGRVSGIMVCVASAAEIEQTAVFPCMVVFPLMRNLPGIIQPSGFDATPQHFASVTEFYPNGSLAVVLDRYQRGNAPASFGRATQLLKCVAGIALIILQFHGRGAIHGDLRLDDVFLDSNFEPMIRDGTRHQISLESSEL